MEAFASVKLRPDNLETPIILSEVAAALMTGRKKTRRLATRIANLGTFSGYRIGLDVGNGNIGWCVLFETGSLLHFLTAEMIANHNAALPAGAPRTQLPNIQEFVPLGTHKFEAREREQKGEKSFSKIRAEKRRSERLLDARQRRKLNVHVALQNAGLWPKPGEGFGGHRRISADRLREKLLNAKFPAHPHDVGRALYVTLKRRGWLTPVGRAGRSEDSAFGTRKTEEYKAALEEFGCETIGQFLNKCARDAGEDRQPPIRKRHKPLDWQKQHDKEKPEPETQARTYQRLPFLSPTWTLVEKEVNLLRTRQQGNVPIDDERWNAILTAAEFRRSLKASKPGHCR